MDDAIVIHWFRLDLRTRDNPALYEAAQHGHVLPIYILDDDAARELAMGGACRVWTHHSLQSLNETLDGTLCFYKGDAEKILTKLCKTYAVKTVFYNECYEPWRVQQDEAIQKTLEKSDITMERHHGSLLWEPDMVQKSDGGHYKVFTPFYRKGCLNAAPPRKPLTRPKKLITIKDDKHAVSLDALTLLPKQDWDETMLSGWTVGEKGAQKCLQAFIKHGLNHYKDGRNLPAKPYVSRLSPHIHHGEISVNTIWYKIRALNATKHTDTFCSELGWREFSYTQLYYNPTLSRDNLQRKFDKFPWKDDKKALRAWQRGQTGIPIVDAGMRELWQTGYMHNRVRMIVGSFLVKNLLLHWHHGERWFWDCLVDADLASNSASWQWVAGCGADAAPYFRIFNPVTQGQKFDPDGEYVKQHVPELQHLPIKYLFNPWEAPQSVLQESGINLGEDYPEPIVDLKTSRQAALDAFAELKNESQ